MKLIEDWKRKFPKLWSVRLALGAAILSAVEAGVSIWAYGRPPIFAIAAGGASLAAAVARVIAQPALAQDEYSSNGDQAP